MCFLLLFFFLSSKMARLNSIPQYRKRWFEWSRQNKTDNMSPLALLMFGACVSAATLWEHSHQARWRLTFERKRATREQQAATGCGGDRMWNILKSHQSSLTKFIPFSRRYLLFDMLQEIDEWSEMVMVWFDTRGGRRFNLIWRSEIFLNH